MLLLLSCFYRRVVWDQYGWNIVERLSPDQVREPRPDCEEGLLLFHNIILGTQSFKKSGKCVIFSRIGRGGGWGVDYLGKISTLSRFSYRTASLRLITKQSWDWIGIPPLLYLTKKCSGVAKKVACGRIPHLWLGRGAEIFSLSRFCDSQSTLTRVKRVVLYILSSHRCGVRACWSGCMCLTITRTRGLLPSAFPYLMCTGFIGSSQGEFLCV